MSVAVYSEVHVLGSTICTQEAYVLEGKATINGYRKHVRWLSEGRVTPLRR